MRFSGDTQRKLTTFPSNPGSAETLEKQGRQRQRIQKREIKVSSHTFAAAAYIRPAVMMHYCLCHLRLKNRGYLKASGPHGRDCSQL